MIELKPNPENHFHCPRCGEMRPVVSEILIQPLVVMADCVCQSCGFEFLQTFASGHTIENEISVDKAGKTICGATNNWLTKLVAKGYMSADIKPVSIYKHVYRECKQVIILNTLDFLYGHVLLKLYNALYHLERQPEFGLVLIIPKSFEWLIPEGCAEAWIVDLKLSQLSRRYENIEQFVKTEFARFDTIFLSNAYSHPEMTDMDIGKLTRVKAFDLSTFQLNIPTFTFVLREDRWWFQNRWSYWLYRIGRKMKLSVWSHYLLSRSQDLLVRKTIRLITTKLPHAKFIIAGVGKAVGLSNYAEDHRSRKIDSATETNWCKLFARSHVVIGIHGSNMLLPTALAAGCVEILPGDRYGNMIQDITVRYSDRRQLFFYRFADQYATPKSVAEKAISMVVDYPMYDANMCLHQYSVSSNDNHHSIQGKEPTLVSTIDDARH